MKSVAIILSGGKGTRLGSDIPKQYIEVCGKPILAYTLMAFQDSSVDEMIIVAADEYVDSCYEIAREYGCSKLKTVTRGGKERYDSVLNGLRAGNDANGNSDVITLIHDGARPFIKTETINKLIESVKCHGAAIAATPCTDTIKLADVGGNIVSTTNRKLTWAAQTPQCFYMHDILTAYEKVIGSKDDTYKGVTITDDAMVYQLAFSDRTVKLVDAGRENIKITTAVDLELAKTIL